MTTTAAAAWVRDTLGIPCSPRTVQSWITGGANGKRLAATRVGHRWAVSEASLRAFVGQAPTVTDIGRRLAAAGW
jgi:hypothetical protein